MLSTLLASLGFSDKESSIYLALIKLTSGTATELARSTRLNRTTVYDVLEVLMSRGLVSKFKKRSHTYFNALDPRQLISYLDREEREQSRKLIKQKQQVQALLPEFISLQNPLNSKPKVQFFEGEKGVREAYENTLTAKEPLRAYTNVAAMFECLPNFFPEYFQRRAKAKIGIRAVFVDNKKSRERAQHDREELRESRFLPNKSRTFSPEIKIYDNKMVIASWQEKMAVMIESKELAELQKTIFDTLWDLLPKER